MMCSRFFTRFCHPKNKVLMKSLLASNYFKWKVWKFCPLFSAIILELCVIFLIVLPLGFVLYRFTALALVLLSHWRYFSLSTWRLLLYVQKILSYFSTDTLCSSIVLFSTYSAADDTLSQKYWYHLCQCHVLIQRQMSTYLLLISSGWKLHVFWLLEGRCPGVAFQRD